MNYILPLLSVLIGYLIALLLKPKAKQNLKLLLAFSGSFLLSLTVIHLLPDVYESDNKSVGIFIMCGILFQIILFHVIFVEIICFNFIFIFIV